MDIRILVVDDEKPLADLIELYLLNEGYEVIKHYQGNDALWTLENEEITLAILDVMLPDTDGFTILRKIREKHHFPVIMLTAKEEETDKITGLTFGADDYMTKPFRPLELIARVKAQLRRFTQYNHVEKEKEENIISVRGLLLNRETHECRLNERLLNLTPLEFSILWVLSAYRGKVVRSEDLFKMVWGDVYFQSSANTIMVHIRHIREKMNENRDNPKYIRTVWGVGYKIEE